MKLGIRKKCRQIASTVQLDEFNWQNVLRRALENPVNFPSSNRRHLTKMVIE